MTAVVTAAVSRSAARESMRLVQRRFLSSGGKVLGEERKATEDIFIKKVEQENMENIICKGPNGSTTSSTASASSANFPDSRASIVDIMDCIEKYDYDPAELKHAMRVIQKKCGPYRNVIEMELSLENIAMDKADKVQLDYLRDVAKVAILNAELNQALAENKLEKEKYAELERCQSVKDKKTFWEYLKHTTRAGAVFREVVHCMIKNGLAGFFRR